MTLAALLAPIPFMPVLNCDAVLTSIGSDSTFTINGAGDKLGFVFQATSTTPPDQIKFRCASFTSTGTIDATLETVDATTGFPSGTPVTNSATGSVSVASTGVKTCTGLSGTAALTVGEFYAVVLTATGGFAGNFTLLRTTGVNGNVGSPYSLTKDSAGAWTKTTSTNAGYAIGFFTAAGASIHMPGFAGAYTATLVSYDDTTNPDERGSRFSLPFPCSLSGASMVLSCGSGPANVNSFTLSLYALHTSGTPTLLASQAVDGDNVAGASKRTILFSAPVDLAANTVYALAIKATSTTGVNLLRHAYAATAELGCYLADNFYATTRNNGAGAFTDTNTEAYAVFPLISRLDDGAGGGGGLAMPVSGRICA